MAFWIIAIAAALVAGLVAARPLLARRSAAAPRAAHDAQVFRDQLKELDRDVARGVVAEADAEATRLEISRRLLAADAQSRADTSPTAAPAALSRGFAALLVIAAPLAAVWLYSDLGAPGAADMPLANRGEAMRPSQQEAEKMMAGRETAPPTGPDAEEFERLVMQLEARLKETPDDPQGIFLYARSLMNLARFKDAWPQFGKLIELRGKAADADIYAGYAEGMILAAGGYISPEAEAALLQVLKREPTNPSARYYLGRLHAQDGAPERAEAIWTALLAESPSDAPWVAPIKAEMAALGLGPRGGDGLPGPTRDEMNAAGSIPPEDRKAMVADMVNRLAERLETEGGALAEWQRLIRSYSVLGDNAKAREAMARAKEAFRGDPAALIALENDSAPLPAPGAPAGADTAAPAEGPQPDRTAMIAGMVERLDARLRAEGGGPEDWLRLITSYSVMGRSEDADAAYREARIAFKDDPAALAMLEAAIEGAPRTGAESDVGASAGVNAAPSADTRGPTPDEVAAAAEMAPADRQAMINGMVGQLHERLQEEGNAGDVNDWGKLMRSYRVIGDAEAVRATYEEAVSIFAKSAISLAYLKEAALLNGVELK